MIQSKIETLILVIVIAWLPFSGFAQDIYPVTFAKDQITYRIGTPAEYPRTLPAALPGYVVLIRPPFDLFPCMSDPEIKTELIAALNSFNSKKATARDKTFFLQNLAHLVLLDIDNVKIWEKDYGEELQSLVTENKFSGRATTVKQLIDDYIEHYLPSVQTKNEPVQHNSHTP